MSVGGANSGKWVLIGGAVPYDKVTVSALNESTGADIKFYDKQNKYQLSVRVVIRKRAIPQVDELT